MINLLLKRNFSCDFHSIRLSNIYRLFNILFLLFSPLIVDSDDAGHWNPEIIHYFCQDLYHPINYYLQISYDNTKGLVHLFQLPSDFRHHISILPIVGNYHLY